MGKLRLVVDCAFAVWFIMSNTWILDGRLASEGSLHCRLLLRLFTFSCMIFAMPVLLCTVLCCSAPCVVRVLGFEEEDYEERGASDEIIAALPVHKFIKKGQVSEQSSDSDENLQTSLTPSSDCETGLQTNDLGCCICLGKYTEGAGVRELPCSHQFHMDCVDRWLKISASCPLCKHEITFPMARRSDTETEALFLLCC